jgi:hypothetical protein
MLYDTMLACFRFFYVALCCYEFYVVDFLYETSMKYLIIF